MLRSGRYGIRCIVFFEELLTRKCCLFCIFFFWGGGEFVVKILNLVVSYPGIRFIIRVPFFKASKSS